MEKIKVMEAFAGYGSQSIALELLKKDIGLDYEVVGISEIDKTATMAYYAARDERLDPNSEKYDTAYVTSLITNRGGYQPTEELKQRYPNYGDITQIDWENVPDFNLLTYSFPCTDISTAGLQKGLAEGSGTRSSLLWECAKAIEAKRPKYLLMENVKALVSDKFIPDFRRWKEWLEERGYANFHQVINSKDFGVPQNRERVFMISILKDDAIYYFPKPFKLERRLKDVLEKNVDESFYLSDDKIQDIINHCTRKGQQGILVDDKTILAITITHITPGGMGIPYNEIKLSRQCYVGEFINAFLSAWENGRDYKDKIVFGDNVDEDITTFANIDEALASRKIITNLKGTHTEAWYNNDPWAFKGFYLADESDEDELNDTEDGE